MKILVAGLLLALAGCLPALHDARVVAEPVASPWTHGYRTDVAGVFVAASTAPIIAADGPGCVLRNTLAGGANSAVSCDAPGVYRLQTAGRVSAGVVTR